MAKSITAATAQYLISVSGLFPVPIALEGYAADDVFATDPVESTEVSMGIDGIMSAGFIFIPIKQMITLQANSPSVVIFDQWYLNQQTKKDVFFANGIVILKSIGAKYAMTNGVLTSYLPMADAGKVLKPRKFGITWERMTPSPV